MNFMQREQKYAVIPIEYINPVLIDAITEKDPTHYLEFLKNLWRVNSGEGPQLTNVFSLYSKDIVLDDQKLYRVKKVAWCRRKKQS